MYVRDHRSKSMKVFLLNADSEHFQTLILRDSNDWARVMSFTEGAKPLDEWEAVETMVLRDPSLVDLDLPPSDFPSLSPLDVFSANAVRSLSDVLLANGKLLPLRCREGDYSAYVTTNVIDALDVAESKMWVLDTGRVVRIEQHVFRHDAVRNAVIFRLSQRPWVETYVTDSFVQRVAAAALTGFRFQEVWSSVESSRTRTSAV